MSGRNAYIGGSEVNELIGAWHQIVGAGGDALRPGMPNLPYVPYARYGHPYQQPYQHQQHQHHHRHPGHPVWWGGQWHYPQQQFRQPSVRDHRRQFWQNQYWVSGGTDATAIGALALMGAEDAQAEATGVPPPDATIPAPPIDAAPPGAAPMPPPAAPPMPMPPPDVALAPPAMPPPSPERHRHHRHHRHHHGGGGWGGPPPGYGYEIPPRNAMVDYAGPSRADRVVLPMSSGVNILPNTSAQITSRPQNVAFRPERLIIGGTPSDWIVNDVKVGNRSQFSQSGDVPGEMFAATTIDSFVSFETVQTAMDFVVLVTFVGTSESGSPFVCGVLGTAAI